MVKLAIVRHRYCAECYQVNSIRCPRGGVLLERPEQQPVLEKPEGHEKPEGQVLQISIFYVIISSWHAHSVSNFRMRFIT